MRTPSPIPDMFQVQINNATSHMWKVILWLHNDNMRRAFFLGTRILKPRRVIFYNNELLTVFKEMEQRKERERILALEAKAKLKAFKHKRIPKSKK